MSWREGARTVAIDLLRLCVGWVSDLSRHSSSYHHLLPECQSKAAVLSKQLEGCQVESAILAGCKSELEWAKAALRSGWLELLVSFLFGVLVGLIGLGLFFWFQFERRKTLQSKGHPVDLVVQRIQKGNKGQDSDGESDERVASARSRARALQG